MNDKERISHLARLVLAVFVFTFVAARVLVLLIMTHRIPDLFFHVGGTHVHHLNYGIFLLSGIGAYLLFIRSTGLAEDVAAVLYAIGLGLTFDEFGMWLHLGGPYWQRASFDAVIVVAALLGLFSAAPEFSKFKARHWSAAFLILGVLCVFGVLSAHHFGTAGQKLKDKFEKIESDAPN